MLLNPFNTSQVVGHNSHTNSLLPPIKYSRNFLLSLRPRACAACPQLLGELKLHGVLKYRGRKSGKKTRGFYSSIFPRTRRNYANSGYLQAPLLHQGLNPNNLLSVRTLDCSPKATSCCVQLCLLNVRSIKNKTMAVEDFVVDQDIDVSALTETWMRPGNIDDVEIGILCPTG